jgi:hypothetical protein
MPEHDTFDIDAAFAGLGQDIAGISSPRGAGAAITAARRRRRTTIGGAVAGLALVVAAAAVGQGLATHDRAVEPTGLPSPAPLDGPHLTAATHGWTPAWTANTEKARLKMAQTFGGACFGAVPGGAPAITELSNSHDDLAVAAMGDYGTRTAEQRADWRRVLRRTSRCEGAVEISSFGGDSGVQGHTFRIPAAPSGSAPQYLWIVSTGHGIGVLKVLGQSDPLPIADDLSVARALLAAVQAPETYIGSGLGSSNDAPWVDEDQFAHALGSWTSRWTRSGSHPAPALDSPCYTPWWRGTSWAANTGGLGGNGRQELALFHSSAAARSAATSLVQALRTCDNAHYAVVDSVENPHTMLMSASGPAVVWIAQNDDTVGVVRVPSAGAALPPQVSTDVDQVLLAAVKSLAASGNGP